MGRLPSLDTLRVFSIAARHMSFTKAAGELHLTQSAISHRVRALEEELGVALFDRLPRRLEEEPVLRIHVGRLPRRDPEKLRVELVDSLQKPTAPSDRLTR